MNIEIPKNDWTNFFNALSKRRFEWTTKVEILNETIGDQVLTEGLPLNGITIGGKLDSPTIGVSVSDGIDAHQTHNIFSPGRVTFLSGDENRSDTIVVEEEDGTLNVLTFLAPMQIIFGFTEIDMLTAAL
jgi:hypothetical protein